MSPNGLPSTIDDGGTWSFFVNFHEVVPIVVCVAMAGAASLAVQGGSKRELTTAGRIRLWAARRAVVAADKTAVPVKVAPRNRPRHTWPQLHTRPRSASNIMAVDWKASEANATMASVRALHGRRGRRIVPTVDKHPLNLESIDVHISLKS
ncbi:hypothetical protein Ae201684P_003287 [Aphanomyces euteiches]|uniref:Uncharacterized protein n=1 Tax=Aphanomyces euteiches TaxID=100861 RepID=A0A6G0W4A5_9STRA|nr:hypothetical protein Ae201684_018842 [Aphanomyces euteiches]KAH9073784.1 hypothetical protein Ae201684P_003287 [Aphanomyces euteiches]